MTTPTQKEVLQLFTDELGLTAEQISCFRVTEVTEARIIISVPCLPGGYQEFEGIRVRLNRKFGSPAEGAFRSVLSPRVLKEYAWKTSDGHVYLVVDVGRDRGAQTFEFARLEITNNGH